MRTVCVHAAMSLTRTTPSRSAAIGTIYQGDVGGKRLAEALRRSHTGEVNLVDAPLAEAAVVGSRITWPASAAEAARLRRRTIIIRMPPGTSRNWSTAHVCQMCCVGSCVMFVGA